MSRYCFIASTDSGLPTVNHHQPDERGRIFFETEDELGDLYIERISKTETYADVEYYTDLPEIYDVDFTADVKRVEELIAYLQFNVKRGKQYELFQIWLANAINDRKYKQGIKQGLEKLHKLTFSVDNLDTDTFIKLFDEHEYLRIKIYG